MWMRRQSALTTAARLVDNWFEFPTLDKKGPQSDVFNGLTAVTYEAIIRIIDFKKHPDISSVMGVEQYLLLRIGDADLNRQQLQFDGSGDGAGFGKFPDKDNTKILLDNEWYHVACTFDQKTRQVRIYVNGKLQSAADEVGSTTPSPINLAMRALYDADPETNKKLKEAYQFFIGRSYDDNRQLNGDIAEVRVWNVARTEEEIWTNMYEVDPATPGLIGYWKFNWSGYVDEDAAVEYIDPWQNGARGRKPFAGLSQDRYGNWLFPNYTDNSEFLYGESGFEWQDAVLFWNYYGASKRAILTFDNVTDRTVNHEGGRLNIGNVFVNLCNRIVTSLIARNRNVKQGSVYC